MYPTITSFHIQRQSGHILPWLEWSTSKYADYPLADLSELEMVSHSTAIITNRIKNSCVGAPICVTEVLIVAMRNQAFAKAFFPLIDARIDNMDNQWIYATQEQYRGDQLRTQTNASLSKNRHSFFYSSALASAEFTIQYPFLIHVPLLCARHPISYPPAGRHDQWRQAGIRSPVYIILELMFDQSRELWVIGCPTYVVLSVTTQNWVTLAKMGGMKRGSNEHLCVAQVWCSNC